MSTEVVEYFSFNGFISSCFFFLLNRFLTLFLFLIVITKKL